MVTHISHSPEETEALGESWGRDATSGWVIGILGDLGAGKTQLVKGLARGLGIGERVQSPTFSLIHSYESGRVPLHHIDLYRLESQEQVIGAGLEDYLYAPAGVTAVEWMERWWGATEVPVVSGGGRVSGRFRRVRIAQSGATRRIIEYEDFGV